MRRPGRMMKRPQCTCPRAAPPAATTERKEYRAQGLVPRNQTQEGLCSSSQSGNGPMRPCLMGPRAPPSLADHCTPVQEGSRRRMLERAVCPARAPGLMRTHAKQGPMRANERVSSFKLATLGYANPGGHTNLPTQTQRSTVACAQGAHRAGAPFWLPTCFPVEHVVSSPQPPADPSLRCGPSNFDCDVISGCICCSCIFWMRLPVSILLPLILWVAPSNFHYPFAPNSRDS